MRRILVDHARARHAKKRGGDLQRVPLDQVQLSATEEPADLISLDEALKSLERFDAQRARIVELRYFGGLSIQETAEVLELKDHRVYSESELALAWLHRELSRGMKKQWKRIEAVFDAAIGIADAERESFLDRECAGDDALRAEVLSLLQARVGADEAISSLATSETLHQAVANPPQLELQGTQLGVYRVGELLGEGGSSLVFRGYRVDEQFERQVAIKVLKWGFQSIDMGRRFADERRILAQLDHPGIARILDGGTSAEGLQ